MLASSAEVFRRGATGCDDDFSRIGRPKNAHRNRGDSTATEMRPPVALGSLCVEGQRGSLAKNAFNAQQEFGNWQGLAQVAIGSAVTCLLEQGLVVATPGQDNHRQRRI